MDQEAIFSKFCNMMYPSSNIDEIKRTYKYSIINKFVKFVTKLNLNDEQIELLIRLIKSKKRGQLTKILSPKSLSMLVNNYIIQKQLLINDLKSSKINHYKMYEYDIKYLYDTEYISINYISVSKKCIRQILKLDPPIISLDDLFAVRKNVYKILSYHELKNILGDDLINLY